jgi:hypothetical protein
MDLSKWYRRFFLNGNLSCIGPYGSPKTLHKGYGYNENLLLSAPASAHTLSFTWAREVVGNGLIYAYALV